MNNTLSYIHVQKLSNTVRGTLCRYIDYINICKNILLESYEMHNLWIKS